MAASLKPLDQQVIVITGASSGIGLATARAAAERGAKLVLAARSEETLQEVVQQIRAEGGEALHVVADVADRAQVERPRSIPPYPQHARNYMEQEPKLPTPMIDPQEVADAILGAAVKPERNVKVGAMATVNTAMFKLAPALGEKMAAKQADRQQHDEPPRDPAGTLFQPGESGRVHGEGSRSSSAH